MSRGLWLIGLALAAVVMTPGAVLAEGPPDSGADYARRGFYLGAGGFYAISDYDLTTSDLDVVPPELPGLDPEFSNTGGVDVRVGYRAFSHLAFEADYQWQAGFDSTNDAIAPPLEIDTHLVSLNAKLFALTGRWQPYGLVGASLLVFNTEIVDPDFEKPWSVDYGFAPRFAAGVDFYVSEHWLLNVEGTYVVPVGSLHGANMGTVGAGFQYRF